MQKKIFSPLIITLMTASLVSCDKDEDIILNSGEVTNQGAYIVCNGNWNENNGSLYFLDLKNKDITDDIYYAENKRLIGDTFQDICIYGSKLYCAVTGSSKIVVLEKNGKEVKEIRLSTDAETPVSPRSIVSYNGDVYFSAFDGYVYKMDTINYDLTGKVQVGSYPEGMTVAKGKLFVNNSNHYLPGDEKNSVSVIDLSSFSNIKTVPVHLNPYDQAITGQDNNVYIVCCGNYGQNDEYSNFTPLYSTLVKIDPDTYETTNLTTASKIAIKGDMMYIIYNDYYVTNSLSYKIYDLKNKKEVNNSFISTSLITDPGFINVNPQTGDIFISQWQYGSLGEIFEFNSSLENTKKYTVGYSPAQIKFDF